MRVFGKIAGALHGAADKLTATAHQAEVFERAGLHRPATDAEARQMAEEHLPESIDPPDADDDRKHRELEEVYGDWAYGNQPRNDHEREWFREFSEREAVVDEPGRSSAEIFGAEADEPGPGGYAEGANRYEPSAAKTQAVLDGINDGSLPVPANVAFWGDKAQEDARLAGFKANYEAGREPATQIEADWHESWGRQDTPGRWDSEPDEAGYQANHQAGREAGQ